MGKTVSRLDMLSCSKVSNCVCGCRITRDQAWRMHICRKTVVSTDATWIYNDDDNIKASVGREGNDSDVDLSTIPSNK
jgi:hypothetical protein